MVEYDVKFIKEYAGSLYKQAKSIVPAHFFIGIFIGFFVFGTISYKLIGDLDFLIVACGILCGGVMGYGSGNNKAVELKLKAQQALCQIQIEENTRS